MGLNGGRGLPEKIFEKRMQMVSSFWAHFCRVRVDFLPQNSKVCNFCFQISDLLYTWCGKNFHLSCRGKAKEGIFFYLLAVGGGGVGVSPRKFLKNGCKWCILSPFLPSSYRFQPPKIVCNFCLQSSNLHDAGHFFPFAWGGGSFRFFFFFFFKRIQMIHSESIHSRLLVGFFFFFFWNFTFVMKAPSCRVCDVGVYRGSHGRSWFFFLCRKDPGGNTAPPPPPAPPNILKNWCNMHSETILADWTFVFYLKVFFRGGGAIYGRRILMIRELLSCNFWGISTILKVQGTSREIILRLLFFGKLRARVSCIL